MRCNNNISNSAFECTTIMPYLSHIDFVVYFSFIFVMGIIILIVFNKGKK